MTFWVNGTIGQFLKSGKKHKLFVGHSYNQAETYHQLGRTAEEQRQWEQAEQYYQQALQIKVDFNDTYAQGSTYHQLGIVAKERRQWARARNNFVIAFAIFVAHNDIDSGSTALRSLALFWQDCEDPTILTNIASIMKTTTNEVESTLKEALATVPLQSVKPDPNIADTWRTKGDILRDLEQYEGALVAYERATELDPGNWVVSLLSVGTRRNKYNSQKLPDRPNMISEGSCHRW